MEMDLIPFVGGVFDPALVFYPMSLASTGIFIWLTNFDLWRKFGAATILWQSLARTWLDTGIISGLLCTSIALMGLLLDPEMDLSTVYQSSRIILLLFMWGGFLTASGYCMLIRSLEIPYRIRPWQAVLSLVIIVWVSIDIFEAARIDPEVYFDIFFNTGVDIGPYPFTYYFALFLYLPLYVFFRKERVDVVLIQTNTFATLGGMAMVIALWFVEGADFLESTDAIFLSANILFMGSLIYLITYIWSLSRGLTKDADYQTKSCHFAEATAFFLFLVFAPVGATEYFRESTDQANQQANNEAQELRIEQLEVQIKLLTEKVGEV